MSATVTPLLEIADEIRRRPDVLAAVTDATDVLEKHAVMVSPPRLIRWRFADRDGAKTELALADSTAPGTPVVRREFWTRWLHDPVNRKLFVLEVWGPSLSARSDANMARINKLVSEIEEEERDGGQVAD